MNEYHIGSKGTEVIFKAGYKNRAARRRMKKLDMHHVHRVLQKPCTKESINEDKTSSDNLANEHK